jgi:hypothetical protein
MHALTTSLQVNGSSGLVRCLPLYLADRHSIGHAASAPSSYRLGGRFTQGVHLLFS